MQFTGKIIITLVQWKIVGFRQGLEGVECFESCSGLKGKHLSFHWGFMASLHRHSGRVVTLVQCKIVGFWLERIRRGRILESCSGPKGKRLGFHLGLKSKLPPQAAGSSHLCSGRLLASELQPLKIFLKPFLQATMHRPKILLRSIKKLWKNLVQRLWKSSMVVYRGAARFFLSWLPSRREIQMQISFCFLLL